MGSRLSPQALRTEQLLAKFSVDDLNKLGEKLDEMGLTKHQFVFGKFDKHLFKAAQAIVTNISKQRGGGQEANADMIKSQVNTLTRYLWKILGPEFHDFLFNLKVSKQEQRLIENIKKELRLFRLQEAVTFAKQLPDALGRNNSDALADCQILQLRLCKFLKNDGLTLLQEVEEAEKVLQDICDKCGYST